MSGFSPLSGWGNGGGSSDSGARPEDPALGESPADCHRKREDPEPTQESASRAVVFSPQARDREQRNLYSSLSAALAGFIFLMSS